MCFRDSNRSGALKLNIPPLQTPITNIGVYHWGMDFRGLSVGPFGQAAPSETIFCGEKTMRQGMESPCGIIPDSGTTLMMGPKSQIMLLEGSLCSKWPRCNALAKGKPDYKLFRELLFNCSDWLTNDTGLHEIPSLFFYVKGASGSMTSFELSAWAW